MRALFLCDFDQSRGKPILPEDDVLIGGVAGQGWLTISYTPTNQTCLVVVNSSAEGIAATEAVATLIEEFQ